MSQGIFKQNLVEDSGVISFCWIFNSVCTQCVFRCSEEVAETQLVPISLLYHVLLKLAAVLPFPVLAGIPESLLSGDSSVFS